MQHVKTPTTKRWNLAAGQVSALWLLLFGDSRLHKGLPGVSTAHLGLFVRLQERFRACVKTLNASTVEFQAIKAEIAEDEATFLHERYKAVEAWATEFVRSAKFIGELLEETVAFFKKVAEAKKAVG